MQFDELLYWRRNVSSQPGMADAEMGCKEAICNFVNQCARGLCGLPCTRPRIALKARLNSADSSVSSGQDQKLLVYCGGFRVQNAFASFSVRNHRVMHDRYSCRLQSQRIFCVGRFLLCFVSTLPVQPCIKADRRHCTPDAGIIPIPLYRLNTCAPAAKPQPSVLNDACSARDCPESNLMLKTCGQPSLCQGCFHQEEGDAGHWSALRVLPLLSLLMQAIRR